MRTYKIYGLRCPIKQEIRYVGKTISPLRKRLRDHISEALRKTEGFSYKQNWIRKLNSQNLKPTIELIEECQEENWQEREMYWISVFQMLTNSTPGGECAPICIKRLPVLKYSLDGVFIQEYESIQEAMEVHNFKKGTIDSAIIRNPDWVYCKNFIWRLSKIGFLPFVKPYVNHKVRPVRITDIQTGERKIFESLKQGLEYFKLPRVGAINTSIDKGVPYKKRYSIVFL